MVGEFMKFLPITALFTMGSSLLVALVFIPVIGGVIGKKPYTTLKEEKILEEVECGNPMKVRGFTKLYAYFLKFSINHPLLILITAICTIFTSVNVYTKFGTGVSFFPNVEPDFAMVQMKSNEPLSIYERNKYIQALENDLSEFQEILNIYGKAQKTKDNVIGSAQLEMVDWDKGQ